MAIIGIVDTAQFINCLENEGRRLIAAVDGERWDAAVPGIEWDLRTLVVHVGAVHRWATDILVRQLPTDEMGGSTAFAEPVADGDLISWAALGHARLVSTLRSADDDLSAFTFLPGLSPRHFWARRQAHETAIHRGDVQGAVGGDGAVDDVDVDFAQDGIAELAGGFAHEPAFAGAAPGVLALHCTDGPSWLIVFGRGFTRGVASQDFSTATATATGTSSALYRWLWNRPAPIEIDGSSRTIASWQRIRV